MDNQNLSAELVRDLIKERRSDRRWKNIRFFIILLIIAGIVAAIFARHGETSVTDDNKKGYVALIRLSGMIAPGQDFSAETVLPILHDAFNDNDAKGVILDINSGGGTPVQASIIHDAILELKKKHNKKVVVVGEDMMASGAYYVAVAADKIYVNPNTITGSIGVIMKEFGFTDLIKKIGVDRRVYASGANKDRLDPFLPQNPEDIAKIKQVISEIHGNFQGIVEKGRAGKLDLSNPDLFTGDFWSGQTALKLGLVDALGNLSNAMTTEFNVSSYKDYSDNGSILKALRDQIGMSLSTALSSGMKVVEEI